MDSVSRVRFRLRTVLAGFVFVIVGFVLLFTSLRLEHGILADAARELATLFIVGGVLHMIYELYLRQDFIRMNDENTQRIVEELTRTRKTIAAKLQLAQQAEDLGLGDTRVDASTFDFGSLLEHSTTLTIVVNDGRTWVSNNADRLRRRFRDLSKSTTFIVLHPTSPMMTVLARKEGSNQAALQHKISETVAMLTQLKVNETKLQVIGHHLFNPHSVFLGDKYAIVSPYFHSRGRRTVPAYRFDRLDGVCFYRELEADVQALLLDADDISDFAVVPVIAAPTLPPASTPSVLAT